MKISVFGLGYVGAVSCACLPELGHEVIGVDTSADKVAMINNGESTVVEEGIAEMIAAARADGRLSATMDAGQAVLDSEVSFISVPTPPKPNYAPDLSYVESVMRSIGETLRRKTVRHTIVLRSTVPPGTTETRLAPILEEAAGRKIGDALSLVFNPEFLREGSSVKDFRNPPQTIVGSMDEAGVEVMRSLFGSLPGQFNSTPVRVAEAVKYLSNVFHALKIVFANEAGSVLKAFDLDSREVLRLLCQDTQLNISPAYLRPGFAFGGSCLPKEVKGFISLARENDIDIPALGGLLISNEEHIRRAYRLVARDGRHPVALFGLSFKPGTDDMRDSPLVLLAEQLLGKGFDLKIFDRSVKISRLMGKNKQFVEREIPHLDRLLRQTPEEALAGVRIVLVGHADKEARAAITSSIQPGCRVVDLAGYAELSAIPGVEYEGICW